MHTPFDGRTTDFDVATHVGRGVFLGGQSRPTSRERGLSAPQFLGFLSIYPYTLLRRSTKFELVTHMERGLFYGVSHASHPKRADFQSSPVFFLYLCLYPLMQNDQIRRGNTHGEGRVFRRSATPLLLHKCVARFIIIIVDYGRRRNASVSASLATCYYYIHILPTLRIGLQFQCRWPGDHTQNHIFFPVFI